MLVESDQKDIQERDDAFRWYMDKLREANEVGPNCSTDEFCKIALKEYRASKSQEKAERQVDVTKALAVATSIERKGRRQENRFPHTCPRCGGPAYIGATTVECVNYEEDRFHRTRQCR